MVALKEQIYKPVCVEFAGAKSNLYKEIKMNFSEALELIKQGKKLTRKNWNGKGMFAYLVHGSEFEVNRAPLNAIYEMGTKIKYRPHIDLNTCGVWSISNNDALAEDWEVVE